MIERAVDPFEIEQLDQRLAHAAVGEERAPRVEHQRRHAGRILDRKLFLDDAAVAHRRDVVAFRPARGIVLGPRVDGAGLEGFEHAAGVTVIVEADLVEIELAFVDRKLRAPVVRIALEGDARAGLHLADEIGAAADRRNEARLLESLGIDQMARQHRHQAHDQRHLAVAAAIEGELHLAVAGLLHARDLLIVGAVVGPPVIAQQSVREDHVVHGDRRAVGELGLRVQRELDEAPIVRRLDLLGDQAIERERLVVSPGEQALIDIFADAFGALAFDDERIETVEGAALGEREPPTLRRIRIGVGKMGEARRLGGLAMHGNARRRLATEAARKQHEEKNEEGKGFQRRRGVAIDASALQHGYQGSMARQGRKV